eukprot:6410329-Amphidinium_carterae.1
MSLCNSSSTVSSLLAFKAEFLGGEGIATKAPAGRALSWATRRGALERIGHRSKSDTDLTHGTHQEPTNSRKPRQSNQMKGIVTSTLRIASLNETLGCDKQRTRFLCGPIGPLTK